MLSKQVRHLSHKNKVKYAVNMAEHNLKVLDGNTE